MTTKKELQTAFDDLWKRYGNTLSMLDDALGRLEKKPKTVEVVKEIVIEKEVPVEKIIEVEVIKEVPVIKKIDRIVEKEVPGPERIVEVPGPERIVERIVEVEVVKEIVIENEKIKKKKKIVEVPATKETIREVVVPISSHQEREFLETIRQLEKRIKDLIEDDHKEVIIKEKIVYKEKVVEGPSRPVPIEIPATGDLRTAATLIANSEMNVNDLSTTEILTMLNDLSTEEVNSKLGFWTVPLPTNETKPDDKDTRYTLKK